MNPAREPIYDENGDQTNWVLPESFIWGDDTISADATQLYGFWMSKYELSMEAAITYANFYPNATSIRLNDIVLSTKVTADENSYEFYLNDELKYTGGSEYLFTGLEPETEYKVGVKVKLTDGTYSNYCAKTIKTISLDELHPNIANTPELKGYNGDITYYVLYDDEGNEDTSIPITTTLTAEQKSKWYDYDNQKWANIVVKKDDTMAYFTWIPRYEYKIKKLDGYSKKNGIINIQFIPVTKTIATEGYIIPESFMWGEDDDITQLSGFWMSKYELSVGSMITYASFYPMADSIRVADMTFHKNVTIDESSFEYYLDGNLVHTGEKGYVFEGLSPNTTYEVAVKAKTTAGIYTNTYKEKITTTDVKYSNEPSLPDLTGFSEANTYYVLYNEDGTEDISIPITTTLTDEQKSKWYDYDNQKWANIVTISGTAKAYFTWIPRYEYKIKQVGYSNTSGVIDIEFIPASKVLSTGGYIIPEAFMWGEDENITQLSGFWMSKYELSKDDALPVETEETTN